jgi:S-adenosylmethionine:tRNA ribosyltransferase-isomerase
LTYEITLAVEARGYYYLAPTELFCDLPAALGFYRTIPKGFELQRKDIGLSASLPTGSQIKPPLYLTVPFDSENTKYNHQFSGAPINFEAMETNIDINEYKYNLPAERIALYPLAQRDQSKLLVYKEGKITHSQFHHLDQFLPSNSLLVFNNTKVIPARLLFAKPTGAEIEIFLLNPVSPSPLVSMSMEALGTSQWHVAIGNAKRWPIDLSLKKMFEDRQLIATYVDREKSIVQFDWQPGNLTFAQVIAELGATPLPPYLKREVEASDKERYQTIYSKQEGAVAAPTAGLHFTDRVFEKLKAKNISTDFLTLHISAGTFQPVKVENAMDHVMHTEQIVITKANLENLLARKAEMIAVGTTSLRTLESLYWYGAKLESNQNAPFYIDQSEPYQPNNELSDMSREQSFKNVLNKMNRDGLDQLIGETSIYLLPGYHIKTVDALITNFHQPGSTLMLLVAACIGSNWKRVYDEALRNDYRFLSYGDSSLLYF